MSSKDFLNSCLDLHAALLNQRVDASISFREKESVCVITANGKSKTYIRGGEIDVDAEIKYFLR